MTDETDYFHTYPYFLFLFLKSLLKQFIEEMG